MPFTPMKKPSILLAVLLAVCSGASASEEMRQVQEELRKRNLYFGDIDGKATPEIQGALRRYQERKGFPASGDLCPLTRKSLNLAQLPETSVAANWPEETVLKSDAARHVSEADQKFLDAIAEQDEMAEDEDLGAVAPLAESRTPTVEKSRPTVEVSTPPPVAAAPEAPYEDLVREYLAASATNTPDQELGFYADQVDYFDHGKVGRDFIENDVQNYRKRWP
ncbi:MAG TPA: peptidoglycan-binding domain-containing protein, partial [Chthoniobacteraceae bacterium]